MEKPILTWKRGFVLAGLILVGAQAVLWLLYGRSSILAAAFDHQMRAAILESKTLSAGGLDPRQGGCHYIIPSEDLLRALGPQGRRRNDELLRTSLGWRLVPSGDWRAIYDSALPNEQLALERNSQVYNLDVAWNSPLLAEVHYNNADLGSYGYKQWYVFVLGDWIHLRTFDVWES